MGQPPGSDDGSADDTRQEPAESVAGAPAADDGGRFSRRRILGGVVGTALVTVGAASLLLGSESAEHVSAGPEAWQGLEQGDSLTQRMAPVTVRLAAGEYYARRINVAGPSRFVIEIAVREGGPIDVYTMAEPDFEPYGRGNSLDVIDDLSATGVRSTRLDAPVGIGTVVIAFDNTPRFGAEPEGDVVIDAEIGLLER